MRKLNVVAALLCGVAFLMLLADSWHFVLDDSFISYRYAENWVQHGDLTWNLGEDPVQGFTSFLWVVVNAAAIGVGLDPVSFSKVFSTLCALTIFGLLAWRMRAAPLVLSTILICALALSPVFALITVQGMETTMTSLIVMLTAYAAVRVTEDSSRGPLLTLIAGMFLAFLSRPDTAVFTAGLGLGLALVFAVRKDWRALLRLTGAGGLLVAALAVYMVWKYSHFGYLFPNPYYIKLANDKPLLNQRGVRVATMFFTGVIMPYVVLAVVLAPKRLTKRHFVQVAPILLGVLLFSGYLLTIEPIQGFAGRYAFPVVPALLLAIAVCYEDVRSQGFFFGNWVVPVLLLGYFVYWPLQHLDSTRDIVEERAQDDRVMVGKALAGLDARMFITESGALPFYSKWTAVDRLGLNSERIAHEGLTYQVLVDLHPDLIQGNGANGPYINNPQHRLQNRYMVENGFEAVVGISKNVSQFHYYFVRRSSPYYDELVSRLRSIDDVEYADLNKQLVFKGVPIAP